MPPDQDSTRSVGAADFTRRLAEAGPILRKVAATYADTAADRHDLVQEISLQLWKAWPRYDPARAFSTWTYRIALNVGISHLRRATRRGRRTVPLGDLPGDPAAGPGADPLLGEQLELLRRLIDGADPIDRAILLLHLDERSHREIAEILGITETNASTRLSRLRQRLRDSLTSYDDDGAAPRAEELTR